MPIVGFWFLPFVFCVFILPQALFVSLGFNDNLSFLIFFIGLISVFFYCVGGWVAKRLSGVRQLNLNKAKWAVFNFLFFLYGVTYFVLFYVYGGVPFIDLVMGGGDAAVLRAQFYKGLEGVAQVFVYIRSILVRGFLPFAVLVLFVSKGRLRFYFYLIVITLFSVSSMEKSLLLWAYVPLLFYTLVENLKKDFLLSLFLCGFFFCVVSFFSLTSSADYTVKPPESQGQYVHAVCIDSCYSEVQNVSLVDQEDYQFLLHDLDEGSTLTYLLNRIIWVPFVTVYDSFYYWQVTYDDYLLFSINRHLSALFGFDYADLERNVFRFQYGSGTDSTGNANASYIAEAYIGFGLTGVILFSTVLGAIFGVIVKSGVKPFVCSLPIIAIGLLSASFLSMLFSGGLLFFLSFFVFFTKKDWG